MGVKIIPASDIRQNLKAILEELDQGPCYITQYSRPKAVLVKYEDYEALLQKLEDLEDLLAMKEALEAPEKEAISLEEYAGQRASRVSG